MKFSTKTLVRVLLVISATLMHTLPAASARVAEKVEVDVVTLIQQHGVMGSEQDCSLCTRTPDGTAGIIGESCFLCPACNKVSHSICIANAVLEYIVNLYKQCPAPTSLQHIYDFTSAAPMVNHVLYNMFVDYEANKDALHNQAKPFKLPCCGATVTNNTPDLCDLVTQYWANNFEQDLQEHAKNHKRYRYNFGLNYLRDEKPDQNQFLTHTESCCTIQ